MKKYVIMLAAMLSLVAACKKKGDEPQPTPNPTRKISGTVELEEHQVEFFASADNSRLDQYVNEDGTIASPFFSGRNIAAWFFVRGDVEEDLPSGGGKQIRTVRLGPQGNGMLPVPGGRARFSGTLKTPKGAKNLKISAIITHEVPRNDQDKDARKFVNMIFKPNPATNDPIMPSVCYFSTMPNKFIPSTNSFYGTIAAPETLPNGQKIVRTNIPYIVFQRPFSFKIVGTHASGQPLKKMIIDNGPGSSSNNCLIFRPSGMLLRLRVEENPYAEDLLLKDIQIYSNTMSDDWHYNFYKVDEINAGVNEVGHRNAVSGQLKEGYYTHISMYNQSPNVKKYFRIVEKDPSGGGYKEQPYKIPPGGKSPWYYLWVMPAIDGYAPPSAEGGAVEASVSINTDRGRFKAFLSRSRGQDKIGSVVPMKLKFLRCKNFNNNLLPLDYVADKNLARSESGQWMIDGDNDNPRSGGTDNPRNQLFHASQVHSFYSTAPVEGRTIDGQKYYLPTLADWSCIFPSKLQKLPTDSEVVSVKDDIIRVGGPWGIEFEKPLDKGKQNVFIPKYRSLFIRSDNGNVYALRLIGGENCHMLAYRYVFKEFTPQSPTTAYLKVKSRLVGRIIGHFSDENEANIHLIKYLKNTVAKDAFWNATDPNIKYSREIQLPARGLLERRALSSSVYDPFEDTYHPQDPRYYHDGKVGSYIVADSDTGSKPSRFCGWAHSSSFAPEANVAPNVVWLGFQSKVIDSRIKGSVRLFMQDPPVPTP
ncbi:hypothetical protein [Porphyromonas sp. COT-239 OH1446]|uniref:hypothetical protein n=1 Tax=Porphyromonas sp. COT-239 OH1446 TaxID=1515613 RepID=UPI00055FEACF|nr:hypothetical protein [Porphyromonas sp. COT-239 OH1446]